MSTGARAAAFVALLAAIFALSVVAGRAVDPDPDGAGRGTPAHGGSQVGAHGAEQADSASGSQPVRLRFRVVDARNATVRDFATEQGRRMHLLVVRRDLSGFQHLHPAQAANGSWSTPLTFPASGRDRLFVQVRHGGRVHTAAFTREVAR